MGESWHPGGFDAVTVAAVNRVVEILMGVDAESERRVQNRRVLTIGVLGAA